MRHEEDLTGMQRAFMRSLREPVFGESRDRTELPPREGRVSDAFVATANRFLSPSASLEPAERLELYHRQYWYRLLDSMEEDFPVLKHLLGADQFWRLIEAYLEKAPSRSYTLRHLGAGLADFIESLRIPGNAPSDDEPERHPAGATAPRFAESHKELIVSYPIHAQELARLEYALCEAFEAADEPPLSPEKLAEVALSLQPHVKLFAFRTAADELWRLAEGEILPEELLAPPATEPRFFAAIYRFQFRLLVERLDPVAFRLLQSLAETGKLETAIECSGLAEATDETQAKVSDWFRVWTERGWLCARKSGARQVPIAFVPAQPSPVNLNRSDFCQ